MSINRSVLLRSDNNNNSNNLSGTTRKRAVPALSAETARVFRDVSRVYNILYTGDIYQRRTRSRYTDFNDTRVVRPPLIHFITITITIIIIFNSTADALYTRTHNTSRSSTTIHTHTHTYYTRRIRNRSRTDETVVWPRRRDNRLRLASLLNW